MHALTCISSYIQNYKKITDYWVWWIWAIYLVIGSCAMWMGVFNRWSNIVIWENYYTLYLTIHSSVIYISFSIFFNSFNLLEGYDMVFIARKEAAKADYKLIQKSVKDTLKRSGILKNELPT